MIRFLADENLNQRIVNGLWRLTTAIDVVRVQDVGLANKPDDEILEWAAQNGRVLLTNDLSTMPEIAYRRVQAGKPLHGVLEIPLDLPLRQVLDEIHLIATCSDESEWAGHVRYLPLR